MTPAWRPRRPPGQALSTFLAGAPSPALPERAALVEAATTLLSGAYVHLRQKQARYGVDPVQQLRVLRGRLTGLTARGFQDELGAIFTALRDRHTGYLAPAPYAGRTAVLPFLVERYRTSSGAVRHMVSRQADWCPRGSRPGCRSPTGTGSPSTGRWSGSPTTSAAPPTTPASAAA
jgi:hypothetical protein